MPLPPVTVPGNFDDPGRNPKCWPTAPVTTASFDRDSLKCYYRCNCYCAPDDLVSRTFLDVYPSGILVNIPVGCCCCCVKDNGKFIWYDDKVFSSSPTGGGICSPYPYWCPHCCNCCGNTLIFRPAACVGCPTGYFHSVGMAGLFCPIDILYGLKDGEGDRVAQIINSMKNQFEVAGREVAQPQRSGPAWQMPSV